MVFLPQESPTSVSKKVSEMERITFVYPQKTKPLSVTGNYCALSCAHCKGHYLKNMERLWGPATAGSIKSYLISGGCDLDGAVPLKDHVELLKKLSRDHRLIAHTGLLSREDIDLVSPYLDAASFNMVGDNQTIKEVYNLDRTKQDFHKSYIDLREKISTYPHITIGLHKGEIKGEYDAVDLIAKDPPEAVVFNVFIPTKGTEYAKFKPPSPVNVMDVISYAKERMGNTPICIGCMRPGGVFREKLDELLLKMDIDRIVMPSKSARREAAKMQLEIKERMECCIL